MNLTPSSSAPAGTNTAFYIFLATVILSPLAFWPSPYVALDTVKTILIVVGVLVSAILLGRAAVREGHLTLPPRGLLWTGVLVAISTILSALASTHIGKSFFGQGFEAGTASLILVFLVGAMVAFLAVRGRPERTVVVYLGIVVSFFILYIFQVLRL